MLKSKLSNILDTTFCTSDISQKESYETKCLVNVNCLIETPDPRNVLLV